MATKQGFIKADSLWYDYDVQVWVRNGAVEDCNHPDAMRAQGCCNGNLFACQPIEQVNTNWREWARGIQT